jgi:Leucine-rich repeat (LRR) protein
VLDNNRLKALDASALARLPALRELRVEGNGLRRLRPAATLPALRALHAGGTRVSDVAEVAPLAAAPRLVDLALAGSPLARQADYRLAVLGALPHLQARYYHAAASESCVA